MSSRVLSGGARKSVIQTSVAIGAAAAVAGVLAACGGSNGTAPAAASTPTAAASTSGNAAYLDCLRQHGANVPTAFPSRNRPTDRPSGVRPSGGFGGGGGGGFFGQSQSPQMQAAVQACASVRPTNGFGGFGGGRGGTQLVAFRNCMTQQGVTIPTTRPTAFPTATSSADRAARYLGGLNPSDPKVAAALKVCSPLLPTPGTRPSSSPTG
ncbi:hypothetical protein [Actinocrinis sp.]|uniref:hypothetical protein n=1 Tax=Actinocrinis sp. TaxID=1920516 RepID=UPI002D42EE99|nr:hypothetical protein [Actinocrinis sp.]HZP50620.1 hypothetical protein [Actinocrinis sp.]